MFGWDVMRLSESTSPAFIRLGDRNESDICRVSEGVVTVGQMATVARPDQDGVEWFRQVSTSRRGSAGSLIDSSSRIGAMAAFCV
jgi:hypothetical protein